MAVGQQPGTTDVLPPDIGVTLSGEAFRDRIAALHKQIYASSEFKFDDVMTCVYKAPEGYVVVDPQLVHDGAQWHLFYVTGRLCFVDEWMAALKAGDLQRAREIPYEEGDGHAVGPNLSHLSYHSLILNDPQGDYGYGLQGDSAIVRYQDHWVNLFSARGPQGTSVCLARSNDLFTWDYGSNNPILWPPDWAMRPGKYGAAFIVPLEDQFLVYVHCVTRTGLGAVQLLTTRDFEAFTDHGPVFQMPLQWRGTMCVEAPCVVCRDGLWHLFVNSGPGTWHAVSDRPDQFTCGGGIHSQTQARPALGTYCLGPFHACRVLQAPEGRWFMIGTRKEEQRRLNREAGILKFRGTQDDEAALLDGLFVCEVIWQGDQPILQKATKPI